MLCGGVIIGLWGVGAYAAHRVYIPRRVELSSP